MSEDGEWIWVVLPDGGPEGYSAPVAAFRTEAEATAYEEHVGAIGYRIFDVCKVPVCRFEAPRPTPGQETRG